MRVTTSGSAGNIFVEYFVLALIVMLATIAFYGTHLKNEGGGARAGVEQAFSQLAQEIVGP